MKKVMNKTLCLATVLCLGSLLMFSYSYAQRPSGGRSPQGEKPCVEEMTRFCSHLQGNRSAIKTCMMDHYEELSDTCKQRINQMGVGRGR